MLCSVLFCSVLFIFSFPFHVFSWANNCAANNKTNGVDNRSGSSDASLSQHRGARAARMDITHPNTRISRPDLSQSALTATNGSAGVIKSFILPRNKTGVVRVPPTFCVSHLTIFPLLGSRCLLALSRGTLISSNLMSTLLSSSLKRRGSRIC